MMLPCLLLTPFVSGVIALLIGDRSPLLLKAVSYGGLLVSSSFLLVMGQYLSDQPVVDGVWILEWQIPWIYAFDVNFHLGLSGLSFWLCALTLLMGFLAVFVSKPVSRAHAYYAALSFATMGALGILLAADIFLFFVFWEIALIPVYFLIMVHGHQERVKATFQYILYTQASGLILLLSILGLVYANFNITGVLTFDYHKLVATTLPRDTERILFVGFMLAFLIKLPAFPLHGWMPSIFTNAPVAIILVGTLVKTAVLGLIRFSWPLLPEASAEFATVMMLIGAISVIYGAILAFGQREPKLVLAYSAFSHAGLLLIGVFCQNRAGFFGVLFLMIAQALSTGGILMMLKHLYRNVSVIDINQMGGLWRVGPQFSTLLLGFLLASIGAPMFGNFIGEWLVLWGTFAKNPFIAILASLGIILGAVYSLWLFQRLCLGSSAKDTIVVESVQLKRSELVVYGFITIVLLALGFYPALVFKPVTAPTFSKVNLPVVPQDIINGLIDN